MSWKSKKQPCIALSTAEAEYQRHNSMPVHIMLMCLVEYKLCAMFCLCMKSANSEENNVNPPH